MRAVPRGGALGGHRIAEGVDLNQPHPLWENMVRGLVYHRQGAGQSVPARGNLIEDGGDVDAVPAGKS